MNLKYFVLICMYVIIVLGNKSIWIINHLLNLDHFSITSEYGVKPVLVNLDMYVKHIITLCIQK